MLHDWVKGSGKEESRNKKIWTLSFKSRHFYENGISSCKSSSKRKYGGGGKADEGKVMRIEMSMAARCNRSSRMITVPHEGCEKSAQSY